MRVQKIIQANPEIFNADQNQNYTEIEAIRKIASMECYGNKIQKEDFEIRQTHTAICNLISLGFAQIAVDLAIKLIPRAESSHHYKIAQDLCNRLITHFYHIDDITSVHLYQSLYDKFSSNITLEHKSMSLYGETILNFKKVGFANFEDINTLLESIKKKLPFDTLWYHYYFYKFKSLVLEGEALEQLLHKAIDHLRNLHVKHTSLASTFLEDLIVYYLEGKDWNKTEQYLKEFDLGSISWFKCNLLYAEALLKQKNIKSNDICVLTMNHAGFADLPSALKEKWKAVYKASVRLLLQKP